MRNTLSESNRIMKQLSNDIHRGDEQSSTGWQTPGGWRPHTVVSPWILARGACHLVSEQNATFPAHFSTPTCPSIRLLDIYSVHCSGCHNLPHLSWKMYVRVFILKSVLEIFSEITLVLFSFLCLFRITWQHIQVYCKYNKCWLKMSHDLKICLLTKNISKKCIFLNIYLIIIIGMANICLLNMQLGWHDDLFIATLLNIRMFIL